MGKRYARHLAVIYTALVITQFCGALHTKEAADGVNDGTISANMEEQFQNRSDSGVVKPNRLPPDDRAIPVRLIVNGTVGLHEDVTLECSYQIHPQKYLTRVIWLKDDQLIYKKFLEGNPDFHHRLHASSNYQSQSDVFILQDATPCDAGLYQCVICDNSGTEGRSEKLLEKKAIQRKPEIYMGTICVTCNQTGDTVLHLASQSASIACEASVVNPTPRLVWVTNYVHSDSHVVNNQEKSTCLTTARKVLRVEANGTEDLTFACYADYGMATLVSEKVIIRGKGQVSEVCESRNFSTGILFALWVAVVIQFALTIYIAIKLGLLKSIEDGKLHYGDQFRLKATNRI